MFEGTLWRIQWCRVWGGPLSGTLKIGEPHESYLYDCPGRHSTNLGSWVNSALCTFRFMGDRVVWLSVLVVEVEEIEL